MAAKKPETKKPKKKSDKPPFLQAPALIDDPMTGRTTIRSGLPKIAMTKLKEGTKRPAGRPSTYTRAMADKICESLSEGKSLASICQPENMPQASTFRRWVIDDIDELSARSARAYCIGHDAIADECLEIADKMALMNPITGAVDGGDIQQKRLRIDTRLRLLGKWAPKKYGDKIDLNHSGNVGIESLIAGAGDDGH